MARESTHPLAPIIKSWLADRGQLIDTILDEVAGEIAGAIAAEVVTHLVAALKPDRGTVLLRRLYFAASDIDTCLTEMICYSEVEKKRGLEDLLARLNAEAKAARLFLGETWLMEDQQPEQPQEPLSDQIERGEA